MQDIPGWLKHTTVWLVLGLGLFLGLQAWQAQQRATRFVVDGQTLEIRRSGDGTYVAAVQWHPEFHQPGSPDNFDDTAMLEDFLAAARAVKAARR